MTERREPERELAKKEFQNSVPYDRFEMAICFLKLENKNWEDDINLSFNS